MEYDFIATLHYKTAAEGGRKNPVRSGYRPQVKFSFDTMSTSGQQIFIDKEIVFPGETVTAGIIMLSAPHFENRLEEGINFDIMEGRLVLGTGTITKIINEKLRKQ